ncbi:MAG: hypothetical protein WBL84_04310 [Xanthobacteraceae bacterium]
MTLGNMRDLGAQRPIASCLLTNAIKCKRGLREMNALNCPALLRAFSAAKSTVRR